MKSTRISTLALFLLTPTVTAQTQPLPAGYWSEARSGAILENTETIRLAPDLSGLTAEQIAAVNDLLAAGAIFQDLYEEARHHQAIPAREALDVLARQRGKEKATENLRLLYRLNQGPIATTLDNKREAFLPVDPQVSGKNVYPWGITREEIERHLAASPDKRNDLLGERTMVRRATRENLRRDLDTLARHSVLDTLHPALGAMLRKLAEAPEAAVLYAVPYSVAWGDQLIRAHGLIRNAARRMEASDPELARYLHNRARDLLSNDYESGDASWVTGRFTILNAQIGAYETYDDALYGVKAFHALSLLLQDQKETAELRRAMGSLQEIEDVLPYDQQKRVRDDISVGVYDVIADFGQARGTNTATILPNDPLFSARYGRTILLRRNIMRDPAIFGRNQRVFQAAVNSRFADHLTPDGEFHRTLWHEIGHYLGVAVDKKGRTLDVALEDNADSVEEMKADLVSLFATTLLRRKNVIDDSRLRSVRAGGIRRTLQDNRPRTDQPYQRMQLAQFNFFLENGLLTFDPKTTSLVIHDDRYHEVVTALLRQVLNLQYQGDRDAASAFFDRWTRWTPELHEALAEKIRAAQGARFRIVRYAALGE
ncbi:MAG TPA: NUDIX hydrolase [Thermoanaerobaculia bacterium]|nr:NUDIX hydrolase [Thermoanaerobaculia bacterium]